MLVKGSKTGPSGLAAKSETAHGSGGTKDSKTERAGAGGLKEPEKAKVLVVAKPTAASLAEKQGAASGSTATLKVSTSAMSNVGESVGSGAQGSEAH
ncbi:hypothetical protein NDU88_006296 [Pleurodeles waltl]|uniref:Microtubule-associated protein 215 n=1 Tax=Pleurodeles waltl TaxID=8319 RepID=A0AAV7PQ87_PLEWA|nr:hypothetical protein NDU88_006296 [Pleurodeles waltl]